MIHHSVHVFIVSHLTGENLLVRIDIPLEKKEMVFKGKCLYSYAHVAYFKIIFEFYLLKDKNKSCIFPTGNIIFPSDLSLYRNSTYRIGNFFL